MVQNIEISRLHEAAYNPRIELEPGMPEYTKLQRDIEEFGLVEPLVWNEETGNVVGGHQRLRVLRDLGWTEVPCEVVHLSLEDEKVLNIALNKIKGEWDYEKLDEILNSYEVDEATLSGFTADELALSLEKLDDIEEDDIPEFEDEEDFTRGSYVIQLQFASNDLARDWAEREGFKGQIKPGSSTTVIRIE